MEAYGQQSCPSQLHSPITQAYIEQNLRTIDDGIRYESEYRRFKSSKKIWIFKCPVGHRFSCNNAKTNIGCPLCFVQYVVKYEFGVNVELDISSIYLSETSFLRWNCHCGNVFNATYKQMLMNPTIYICRYQHIPHDKYEERAKIIRVLEDAFGVPFDQQDIRLGNKQFDAANFDLKICIMIKIKGKMKPRRNYAEFTDMNLVEIPSGILSKKGISAFLSKYLPELQ